MSNRSGMFGRRMRKKEDQIVALFGDIVHPNSSLIILSAAITFLVVYLLVKTHISHCIASYLLPGNKLVYLVIVTPIIEELLKFSSYGFIFILAIQRFFNRSNKIVSSNRFIKKNVLWMAFTVGLFFGLFEGILYLDLNETIGDFFAHVVSHIVFTITPVLYWMHFRKNILIFLLIAIIMHSLSNYRYITSALTWPIIVVLFITPICLWWKDFKEEYKNKKICWVKKEWKYDL